MLTHEEILEVGKFMSDFFKQMITLDTGMIVLIFTLVQKVLDTEKVFRSKSDRSLMIITLATLVASLLLAINALVVIPARVINLLQGVAVDRFVDNVSLYGTIYLFFVGVFLFIVLAVRTTFQIPRT